MMRPVLRGIPVTGVLFDIDDTLVDSQRAFALALAAIAEVWLPDLDPGREAELLVHWRADAQDWYGRYTRGEVSYRDQRIARANLLHRDFGGPELDHPAYDRWSAVFEQRLSQSWSAHADAAAVVDRLAVAGVALGALSNASSDYQIAKLACVGLADRVPLLVGVDTLGFGKPDPRVFTEACRRLGTDPGQTVYIGDEPELDARAASAAGLFGIWLNRGDGRTAASAESAFAAGDGPMMIRSLSEVPTLLGLDGAG